MKTGKLKKILASVLTITMAFTLIAFNSHINAEDKDNGLKLDKTAKLNADGTATITLEAYATGKVTTTSIKKPTDYVLVIDQSGSIAKNNQLQTLKNAVTKFVTLVANDKDDKGNKMDHRVSMTGFACDENGGLTNDRDFNTYPLSGGNNNGHYRNTGLYINGILKNYVKHSEIYLSQMDKQSQDYYILDNGREREVKFSNNNWQYYTWRGWENFRPKINSSSNDRYRQVYKKEPLTSEDYKVSLIPANISGNLNPSISTAIKNLGSNGGTYAYYGMNMANNVFKSNPINSDERNRVVVFFTDGNSENKNDVVAEGNVSKTSYGSDVYVIGLNNTSTDSFLNRLSSNYESATTTSNGYKVSDKYYYPTSSSADLDKIFEAIYEQSQGSSTTLDSNAVISDYITHTFKNPTYEQVKVYTSNYLGDNRWSNKAKFDNANISISDNRVNVQGFDYSSNYVMDKDISGKPTGKKLIIEITVTPIDGFIGGNGVLTNDEAIIMDKINGNKVDTFPQPTVDIPLQYDFDNYDATIYIGDDWKELVEFVDDSTKSGIQYKINGKEYTIDGINNEYADIEYVIKDGDVIVGNYKVNGGEKTWRDIKTEIDSTKLTDCHNYTINLKVTPRIQKKDGVADLEVNKKYSTLHILKPSINLTDETIFLGDNTDLTNRVSVNDKWNCNHPERPEPSTKTPTLNYTFDPEQKDQGTLNGSVYTPNIKKDTDFSLSVYNGKTNITQYTKFHNDTQNIDENTFKIKVVAGRIVLSKKLMNINDIDLSDGDPIFAFEIKATDGLYNGQTFYRYVRMTTDGSLVEKKVMPAIEDLPKGTYEITELSTLRYSFVNSQVNTSSSTTNRTVQVTINGVESAEQKVSYTNKVKSKDYDSDNDVLINKFVKDKDGKVTIVQEKLSK